MIKSVVYGARDDGVTLIETFSDKGMMIRQNQTNILYSQAIDIENKGYTYTETDIPIESEDIPDKTDIAMPADYELALRDLGVNV